MRIFDVKEVVLDQELPDEIEGIYIPREPLLNEQGEEIKRFNPKTEIMLKDALLEKPDVKLGEHIRRELEITADFGRMAAQTAKQVITQKLREAERNAIYEDFKGCEGTVVMGSIGRRETRHVLVDIGKATGILPIDEQVPGEQYRAGAKMKMYVVSVAMTSKGPEIVLSRSHIELVREVFTNEIPEIASGVVTIKGIAREPGNRSKVAVSCDDRSIDPIGSCIGQRGTRIQTIIAELGGEKIDLIQWSADPKEYIIASLAPATISSVVLSETTKNVSVGVAADQFSLAIGKGGQNVRLAAKLTGWNITVAEVATESTQNSDDSDLKLPNEESTSEIEETIDAVSDAENTPTPDA